MSTEVSAANHPVRWDLRRVTPRDYTSLISILSDRQVADGLLWHLRVEQDLKTFLNRSSVAGAEQAPFGLVAYNANSHNLAGMVAINEGYISYFVKSGLWGRGIGSKLVGGVCELAARQGIMTIRALVGRENTRSARILEKQGFEFTGLKTVPHDRILATTCLHFIFQNNQYLCR